MRDFHGQMAEPECDKLFDFDFERSDTPLDTDLTKEEVQALMYSEMSHFRYNADAMAHQFNTRLSLKGHSDENEVEEAVRLSVCVVHRACVYANI